VGDPDPYEAQHEDAEGPQYGLALDFGEAEQEESEEYRRADGIPGTGVEQRDLNR